MRYTLCLLTILLWSVSVHGQGKAQREYSSVFDTYYFRGPVSYTGSISMFSYRGDLSKRLFGTMAPGFSVGANYKLWPRTIFGAEFFYFRMASKDVDLDRNIGFKSSNLELDLYGRLLLIDDIQRRGKDKLSKPGKFKPYIMGGIGLLKYTPSSYYYGPTLDSVALQKEGVRYPRWGIVIPVGIGLSVFITHRVSMIAEMNYRITFSDHLDDVSKRANPAKNDGYTSLSLKVQYTPTAQKTKKKKTHTAPTPYEGTKGTETWKTKKKKPKEEPYQENQDQPLPQEENQETNPDKTNPENTNPDNGGGKIENQIEETPKESNPDEIK